MKEYIFDEKTMTEAMMAQGQYDETNINKTIKKLARYNHYIQGLTPDDSYREIVDYMRQHCPDFTEVGSYNDIKGCIKDAPKGAWKSITQVVITKEELDIIQSLNDIRQEKLAFVLLADTKYDNACKEKQVNVSFLSNSDLYKLSRVTMPTQERNLFLHFLYEKELVEININPTSKGKRLLYVSENDENVGLVLKASNYQELAFTYMNWKNGGYKECKKCGRLFKTNKNGNQMYCKKHSSEYHPAEEKKLICIDCKKEFIVDGIVKNKCRCDDCQKDRIRKIKTAKQREYRQKG